MGMDAFLCPCYIWAFFAQKVSIAHKNIYSAALDTRWIAGYAPDMRRICVIYALDLRCVCFVLGTPKIRYAQTGV